MSCDPRLLALAADAAFAAGRCCYAAERTGSPADLANARQLLADVERRAHELLAGVPLDSLDGVLVALRVASAIESVVSRHGAPGQRYRARARVQKIEQELAHAIAGRRIYAGLGLDAFRRLIAMTERESRGTL